MKPRTIDEYLISLDRDSRVALQQVLTVKEMLEGKRFHAPKRCWQRIRGEESRSLTDREARTVSFRIIMLNCLTFFWRKGSMRNSIIVVFAALVAFSAPVQAQSVRQLLLEGKEMLADGANHDDQDKLLEARALFEQATIDDSLAIFAHYYAASAASELANILAELDDSNHNRKILEYVNYAIDHLEAATDRDEVFAEG